MLGDWVGSHFPSFSIPARPAFHMEIGTHPKSMARLFSTMYVPHTTDQGMLLGIDLIIAYLLRLGRLPNPPSKGFSSGSR